jgi:hypothetical protein
MAVDGGKEKGGNATRNELMLINGFSLINIFLSYCTFYIISIDARLIFPPTHPSYPKASLVEIKE